MLNSLPKTGIYFRRLALTMYLLAHPKLHKSVVETAKIDLLNFLNEYEWCYGCENIVYNVHSLQHLPDDVRAHGPLDSFSAFPFESYMRQIKDSVCSRFAAAKQAAQRYAERMSFSDRLQISGLTNTTPIGANDVSTKQVIMFNNSKITSCQPDNNNNNIFLHLQVHTVFTGMFYKLQHLLVRKMLPNLLSL
ncbi:unnamed protein product [Schistosoma curassoni]|uniref:DUF4218 domain-containing protein n=1 Tax=Schistosoma curassoni TaxID=6186 RepID=A0A183KSM0_9TREM|nr:unnamed protein product [Schistosoma curassoni]